MWPFTLFSRCKNGAWRQMTDSLKVIYHRTLDRKHLTLSHGRCEKSIKNIHECFFFFQPQSTRQWKILLLFFPKKPHCCCHSGPGTKKEHFLGDVSHLCGMKASFPEREHILMQRALVSWKAFPVWQGVEVGEGERRGVKWEGVINNAGNKHILTCP